MTPAGAATFTAVSNGVNVVIILSGWMFIRRERKLAHAGCMLLASAVSVAYLTARAAEFVCVGSPPLAGQSPGHPLIVFLRVSHLALGLAVVPMVAVSMITAFQARWRFHRRIANLTMPVWLYVSISGAIIGLSR